MRNTEEQALAFRARRHGLIDGTDAPHAAAAAIVGVQAQVVAPALWSMAVRMATPPTAAELGEALASSPRLVRTWGQRGTVHVFDTHAHWAPVVACLNHWTIGERGGEQIDEGAVDAAERRMLALRRPATRTDLFDLVPDEFLAYMASRTGPGTAAQRGAAGRFFMALSRRGTVSAHTSVGNEQSYVLRVLRYPDLPWPELSPLEAARQLVRDYLRANAPARVQDVAYFFGMKVGDARSILRSLDAELVTVECGGRSALFALEVDQEALQDSVPDEWPARLLPRFDTLLMSHQDKSWTLLEPSEAPRVWAKAGQVNATVLHRGRLVATWEASTTRRAVTLTVNPLRGWTDAAVPGVEADAERYARHLGLASWKVVVNPAP